MQDTNKALDIRLETLQYHLRDIATDEFRYIVNSDNTKESIILSIAAFNRIIDRMDTLDQWINDNKENS